MVQNWRSFPAKTKQSGPAALGALGGFGRLGGSGWSNGCAKEHDVTGTVLDRRRFPLARLQKRQNFLAREVVKNALGAPLAGIAAVMRAIAHQQPRRGTTRASQHRMRVVQIFEQLQHDDAVIAARSEE